MLNTHLIPNTHRQRTNYNATKSIELEHLDGSSIALRFMIITIIKAMVTNQAIVLNKG